MRKGRGPNAAAWKGGRSVVSNGRYMGVYIPDHPMAMHNGYVLEHRLVMAEHLGRNLESSEIVHHLNGDTFDNAVSNLSVTTRSDHINHHRHELEAARGLHR